MADNFIANQYERYQAKKQQIARKKAEAKVKAFKKYQQKMAEQQAEEKKKKL
jgi:DNA-directed RNA polymerase subunit N (RpoN/RPB10)